MCGQSQVEVTSFLYIEILHRVQKNIHIRRLLSRRGKDEEEGFQNFSVKIIKYFLSRWDVLVLSE